MHSARSKAPAPIATKENLSSKYVQIKSVNNDEKPMIAMGLYFNFI